MSVSTGLVFRFRRPEIRVRPRDASRRHPRPGRIDGRGNRFTDGGPTSVHERHHRRPRRRRPATHGRGQDRQSPRADAELPRRPRVTSGSQGVPADRHVGGSTFGRRRRGPRRAGVDATTLLRYVGARQAILRRGRFGDGGRTRGSRGKRGCHHLAVGRRDRFRAPPQAESG